MQEQDIIRVAGWKSTAMLKRYRAGTGLRTPASPPATRRFAQFHVKLHAIDAQHHYPYTQAVDDLVDRTTVM